MHTFARRSFFALVAVLTLSSAVALRPAHATPSQEELANAVLTAQELGSGFTVGNKGPLDELTAAGVTSYSVIYQRATLRGIDLVALVLIDLSTAPDSNDFDVSGGLGQLKDFGITLTPANPPAIGSDTKMYTIAGSVLGVTLGGEAISWRHGSVAAVIAAIGSSNPTAQGYAEKQESKLGTFPN
jgi:hypothetical protein